MNLNRYISAKQNHIIFYSEMTTCSGLKRPSSGHHYRSSKMRYNSMKIMLVISISHDLKVYIKLYKNHRVGNTPAFDGVRVVYKKVKCKYIIIKMLK